MTYPLSMSSPIIRAATPTDVPAMAVLAARLVALHHTFDPRRFWLPDDVEGGFTWWFGREIRSPEVVMRVALIDDAIVGYTYARLEERDWNALLDACGALHDIYVDDRVRHAGLGEALLRSTLDGLKALGAPRVVLSSAWQNEGAQRLFERTGFRRTMVEMTCEL
jgi:ribosomal protein S18 acetylase RimI-like enzyme